MPLQVLGGIEIKVDEEGYIQEPAKWSKAVAEDMAKIEGAYPLSDDAWKLVNFLRKYYHDFGLAPPIRVLTGRTGLDLKTIYRMFPSGPAKGACKIAGLPRPTGCV